MNHASGRIELGTTEDPLGHAVKQCTGRADLLEKSSNGETTPGAANGTLTGVKPLA